MDEKRKDCSRLLCSNCDNLRVIITRHGFAPQCKKKVFEYKERERIDWKHDEDLQWTCLKHVPIKA